jgi:hypothetical protein
MVPLNGYRLTAAPADFRVSCGFGRGVVQRSG